MRKFLYRNNNKNCICFNFTQKTLYLHQKMRLGKQKLYLRKNRNAIFARRSVVCLSLLSLSDGIE